MKLKHFVMLQAAAVLLILLVLVARSPQHLGLRWASAINSDPSVTLESTGSSSRGHQGHDLYRNISVALAPVNTSIHTKVLLVTYMRSGSSFTGDLLNHHPQVFYVYEPLYSLKKMADRKYPLCFFNREPALVDASTWPEPHSVAERGLQVFLNCDFYSLDQYTLRQVHLKRSLTTRGFYECQNRKPGILGTLECLPLLFETCRRSKVAVAKTIRITMEQAAHLMVQDPTIKVIHLVRDPRATLRSQIRVGMINEVNMMRDFRSFCLKVLADLETSEKMKAWFPGRVLSIRYEDLATDPLPLARKLLHFAGGLEMGPELESYVWNITSAGFPDGCAICTTRNNSTRTATRWRLRMRADVSRLVDHTCAEVYRRRGYLPLPSRDVMNDLRVPSFVEYDKVPGLWG